MINGLEKMIPELKNGRMKIRKKYKIKIKI